MFFFLFIYHFLTLLQQVGTLLQLSELLKQTGDFHRAGDFIERCLYVFDCGWNREYDWKNGKSRILYSVVQNKDLFHSIFKYIHMLSRRGCSRTALEYCKLIISFDPSDPLFIIGILDYFAIRSKQYPFLLDFFHYFTDKSLFLPNVYYSIALAKFLMEVSISSFFSFPSLFSIPSCLFFLLPLSFLPLFHSLPFLSPSSCFLLPLLLLISLPPPSSFLLFPLFHSLLPLLPPSSFHSFLSLPLRYCT